MTLSFGKSEARAGNAPATSAASYSVPLHPDLPSVQPVGPAAMLDYQMQIRPRAKHNTAPGSAFHNNNGEKNQHCSPTRSISASGSHNRIHFLQLFLIKWNAAGINIMLLNINLGH